MTKEELFNSTISIIKALSSEEWTRAEDLANELGLSKQQVQNACLRLKYSGVLTSKKSWKGGYKLKTKPTVKQILLTLNIPIFFTGNKEVDKLHRQYLNKEIL